LTPNIKLD
jgi:hypothetical protein